MGVLKEGLQDPASQNGLLSGPPSLALMRKRRVLKTHIETSVVVAQLVCDGCVGGGHRRHKEP